MNIPNNDAQVYKPDSSSPWQTVNTSSITLRERFDHQAAEFIIKNLKDDYIQRMLTKSTLEDEKQEKIKVMSTLLRSYLKHSKDGEITIVYRQQGSERRTGGKMGRFYVDGKTYGLQPMTKSIRHTLGKNHYHDLDIVNCHPTILLQYCERGGWETPILERYVNEREAIIKESGMDREAFKVEFLAILNGRDYMGTNSFLIEWYQEAKSILDTVAKIHKGKIYPSKLGYNENGSITNKFICGEESTILFYVFNYLWAKGYDPMVLCFDGIMVKKNSKKLRDDSTEAEFDELFSELSSFVLKYTGYKIKFSRKEMDKCLDFSQVREKKSTGDFTEILPELDESVRLLLEAMEEGDVGLARLYYNLFAKENVKIVDKDVGSGYIWSDEEKIWVEFSKARFLCTSVLDVLGEFIKEQNERVKAYTESDSVKPIKSKVDAGTSLIRKLEKQRGIVTKTRFGNEISQHLIGMCFNPNFTKIIDMDIYHLPIRDGMKIDLRTGDLFERTQTDYFSYHLSVGMSYNNEKYSELCSFTREIMGISPENEEKFREDGFTHNADEEYRNFQILSGYSISGDTSQKTLPIWYGDGDNGKSSVARLQRETFGPLVKTVDKQLLSAHAGKNRDPNAPSPALIYLNKAHIGQINEVGPDFRFNEDILKQLISGGDGIVGRKMRAEQQEIVCLAKLSVLANKIPTFNGADNALTNRLRPVPFLNKFERSQENIQKVNNIIENYRDEFFRWCVEGSIEYFRIGYLPLSETGRREHAEIKTENDDLQCFIDEYCEREESFRYKKSGFHTTYVETTRMNLSRQQLGDMMRKKGYRVVKINGIDHYKGIRQKPLFS